MTMIRRIVNCSAGVAWMLVSTLVGAQTEVQSSSQSSTSDAQDTERAHLDRARAAYDEGAEAFSRGRFGEALDRFSEAYELSARAELLYNIGTAHDRHGHRDAAIRYYQRYLAALPEAGNREYTEARIAVLEREVASGAGGPVDEENSPDSMPDSMPVEQPLPAASSPANTPAIALVSLGGAAAIAAIATGVITLGRRSELDEVCPNRECRDVHADEVAALRRTAISTDILIGVAGASLVTGIILFLVGDDDSTDDSPQVSCGLNGCDARFSF
ncbi:MAG: tetratricopeptide (TPR) repeat protein [Polyangiales bacterium]|jgi:tetratricopeptide (TPR) repeat protein